MSELAQAQIVNLFPTPFLCHQWDDTAALNKALRQQVLAQERAHPGSGREVSNVGGWHSATGMLEFCGEAGQKLVGMMIELANLATQQTLADRREVPSFGWKLECWANVNRNGDFNRSHIHGLSTWSGTYYVDPGDPPADAKLGTALEIADPSDIRKTTFFPGQLSPGIFIRPEPGLMVLFPSYVPHMVMPHRGAKPRLSIAFNLRKEPFP